MTELNPRRCGTHSTQLHIDHQSAGLVIRAKCATCAAWMD